MNATQSANRLAIVGPGVLLALLILAPSRSTAADPFVRGDVNLDGAITLADASLITDLFIENPPKLGCDDAADVTDNGLHSPADILYLLNWLFRANTTPSPPPIPAPFPARGSDPTADGLGCADSTARPPAPPDPGYKLQWEAPASVVRGEGGVQLFLRATTAAPIEAFSIAYRVDRRIVGSLQADFEGTIFPAARRAAFEASQFFRVKTHPAADPNYDVLLVSAIFAETLSGAGAGPIFRRIVFQATSAPVKEQRLLRIKLDVRSDAPVAKDAKLLLPALPGDLQDPALGGLYNELVAGPARVRAALEGSATGDVLFDPQEFLFVRGDSNHDREVDIADPVFTLLYLMAGGERPRCIVAANALDDEQVDVSDPIFTLNWLFLNGAEMAVPNLSTGCGHPAIGQLISCDESECP